MSLLFQPITIRNLTLRNRIVVSPMCQYSATDGFANDWHLVHLGSRAIGGAGLVIAEAAAISPEGRITPQDLGIWCDGHIEFLQRITDFITEHGAVPGIQLAHAGRKASHRPPWDERGAALEPGQGDWQTVAPSNIPFKESEPEPEQLSAEGIQKVISNFKAAAQRAVQAGFKVVEIHTAHGYLLHEFLSPLSNQRTDDYGGSFENRIRIVLEIATQIRELWPQDWPVFVRISATDWTEGGWTVEDSIQLAQRLKGVGIDLIDCSTGGNIPHAKIPTGPLYQVPFAEQVKKGADIMTGAVGLITTAAECEQILTSGQADLVLLARELLRNPYFPLQAAKELGAEIEWPVQYERAKL